MNTNTIPAGRKAYSREILLTTHCNGPPVEKTLCKRTIKSSKNPVANYTGVTSHASSWLEGAVAVVEAAGLPVAKAPSNARRYGNLITVSTPLLLHEDLLSGTVDTRTVEISQMAWA